MTSRISDAEGNVSTLQQTAADLTSRISDAEGNVSTLQQTATDLTSSISDAEGAISTLQHTVNGLTVTDWTGTTYINGSSIYTDNLYVDAANITGTVTAGKLGSGSVSLLAAGKQAVGSLDIAYTQTGYGLEMSTQYGGIRMNPAGNWWVNALHGGMGITESGVVCNVSPVPQRDGISLGTYGFQWSDLYTAHGKFSDLVDVVADIEMRVSALEKK